MHADAGETQLRALTDAGETRFARVLDAVFDKLFLGSTVVDVTAGGCQVMGGTFRGPGKNDCEISTVHMAYFWRN